MAKIGVIYEILYPSGKRYIGKDSNWPHRKKAHIYQSKKDTPSQLCEKKMAEHGYVHIRAIARFDTTEDLDIAEEFYIALYQTNICRWKGKARGYNLTDGGEGVCGLVMSEEMRQKMSEAKREVSEETRRKLREAWEKRKLIPMSDETRRRRSEAKKGKTRPPFSEATKEKLRVSRTGSVATEKAKAKMRASQQLRRLREKNAALALPTSASSSV